VGESHRRFPPESSSEMPRINRSGGVDRQSPERFLTWFRRRVVIGSARALGPKTRLLNPIRDSSRSGGGSAGIGELQIGYSSPNSAWPTGDFSVLQAGPADRKRVGRLDCFWTDPPQLLHERKVPHSDPGPRREQPKRNWVRKVLSTVVNIFMYCGKNYPDCSKRH